MKLVIFTLVLDGMPFIQWQLPIFQRLKCDWKWVVCEGAAQNNGSTRWCKPQEPRLSNDGTTEYLHDISTNRRVHVIQRPDWKSKDEMCNAALEQITEPCVLMQIDADEIYKPETIAKIAQLFANDGELGAIKMYCRYWLGPRIAAVGKNCWSNKSDEWVRAWRFSPECRFLSHEPPNLQPINGRMMDRDEAAGHDLTFDHFAYTLPAQVEYKERFYGYVGLANQWRALQENKYWPVRLARFFPFVDGIVQADLVK